MGVNVDETRQQCRVPEIDDVCPVWSRDISCPDRLDAIPIHDNDRMIHQAAGVRVKHLARTNYGDGIRRLCLRRNERSAKNYHQRGK